MKKKLPIGFGQERPNELFKRRHQSIFEFCLRTPHPAVNDYWEFCALAGVHPDEIDALPWYLY
jgi:hypothetical protein